MKAAVVISLMWASYSLMLYGYCLVRGYSVTVVDLVNPANKSMWTAAHWPPADINDPTVVLPGKSNFYTGPSAVGTGVGSLFGTANNAVNNVHQAGPGVHTG